MRPWYDDVVHNGQLHSMSVMLASYIWAELEATNLACA